MADLVNFYENVEEAQRRLQGTVIKYENDFFYVHRVAEHADGIARLYLHVLPAPGAGRDLIEQLPANDVLDEAVLAAGTLIRKKINSPKFNGFRPFNLGMMNYEGNVYFINRRSMRQTRQGLRHDMLTQRLINLVVTPNNALDLDSSFRLVNVASAPFVDMLKGSYPNFKECVKTMRTKGCLNTAVAFSREYCIIKGPCSSLFLANNTGPIGIITEDNKVILEDTSKYLRESLTDAGITLQG